VAVGHASTLKKLESVLALRKHHAGRSPCDRDAEEERQGAEISHGKLGVELLREALKEPSSGGGDDDVVHVQEDEGEIRATLVDKQRDIRLGGDETKPMREEGEPLVPRPRSLLEAVE
jgi:hypothetical protein